MKKTFYIGIFLIFLIGSVSALQTLGTFPKDNSISLLQSCDNSSYSNITRVTIPPINAFAINTETEMTKNQDNYNYTFSNTSVVGQYIVYGHCDEDGVDTEWVYDFWITSNGEQISLSNVILVIVFLFLIGLFLALSHSFSREHWILKTFFNFSAVGMGILAVNSGKIIASESTNLGKMGTTGLTLMIVVFLIFFLYMFVYAFIEAIKMFKEKRGVRWKFT